MYQPFQTISFNLVNHESFIDLKNVLQIMWINSINRLKGGYGMVSIVKILYHVILAMPYNYKVRNSLDNFQ